LSDYCEQPHPKSLSEPHPPFGHPLLTERDLERDFSPFSVRRRGWGLRLKKIVE